MDLNGLTPKDMDVFYEASADEPIWYVFRDERHFGPFSIQWLQELISLGVLHQDHHVWQPKLNNWKPIRQFENLRSYSHAVTQQNLSDNDFESILQAEEMKQERRFEMESLDFVELSPPERAEPLQIAKIQQTFWDLKRVLQKLKDWRQEHQKASTALGLASGVFLILISVYFATGIHLNHQENTLLEQMNSMDRAVANEILAQKAEDQKFKAGLFVTNTTAAHHLVLVSNFNQGDEKLILEVKGINGTLVGYQRWNKSLFVSADKYVQKIPIELISMEQFPAGQYEVVIRRQQPADQSINDFSVHSQFKYTRGSPDEYRANLRDYNAAMESQRYLEQEEIVQVQEKLLEHFDFTLGEFQKFRKLRTQRQRRAWGLHLKNWHEDQKKFNQVFASLGSPDFVSQLVYSDLYLQLNEISRKIASLQKQQESIVLKRKTASVAKSASLAKSIQQSLSKIKIKTANWTKN